MNRILYIDLLKCLAIFLVVLGHAIGNISWNSELSNAVSWYFICPLVMPLFSILSGLFFKAENGWRTFLWHKTRQLVMPILTLSFLQFVVLGIVQGILNGDNIHYIAIARNYYMAIIDWNFWFLRALFFCYVFSYVAVRLTQGRLALAGILSVLLLYSLSMGGIIPNKSPILTGFIFLYPFFWTGILLRRVFTVINNTKLQIRALIASLGIYILLLFGWRGYEDSFYSMNTSILEIEGYNGIHGIDVVWRTVYRLLIGIAESLAFIFAFRIMERRGYLSCRAVEHCAAVGRETLGIYILQSFVFNYSLWTMRSNSEARRVIVVVVLSLVIVVGAYIIVRITSQNRYLAFLLWGRSLSQHIYHK